MSGPAWMPLNVGDYRKDTAHLGAAEHGADLLLIMHYWQTGGLPDDDRQLARIACMTDREWKKARLVVQAFFHDGWRHKRIDKEIAHAADVIAKRRAAAEQRYNKRDANADAKAPANAGPKGAYTRVPPKPEPDSSVANATGADAPPDPSVQDRDLFARGREILGKNAGGMIAALKHTKGGNVALARAALEQASQTTNPAEYVGAIIQNGANGRGKSWSPEPRKPSVLDVAKRKLAELEQAESDFASDGLESGYRDLRLISQA
jgi:uncharacterized protein YdaU (DUF1376 family)